MKKPIKAIYLNVTEQKGAEVIDFVPTLENYYELLDCDLIDIVSRSVAGKPVDIICDDCGLLKDEPIISAITNTFRAALVGNLIICGHDGKGNEASLDQQTIDHVMEHIIKVRTLAHREGYKLLTGLDR